jgi:hypothetical protein
MDIVTLAIAKAYTDSKGAKEIVLADYGIDLYAIVNSGEKMTVVNNLGIWDEIDKYKNVVFVCNMGQVFKIVPTMYAYDENGSAMIAGFTLVALAAGSTMMEVEACLVKNSGAGTVVACTTTITALS